MASLTVETPTCTSCVMYVSFLIHLIIQILSERSRVQMRPVSAATLIRDATVWGGMSRKGPGAGVLGGRGGRGVGGGRARAAAKVITYVAAGAAAGATRQCRHRSSYLPMPQDVDREGRRAGTRSARRRRSGPCRTWSRCSARARRLSLHRCTRSADEQCPRTPARLSSRGRG